MMMMLLFFFRHFSEGGKKLREVRMSVQEAHDQRLAHWQKDRRFSEVIRAGYSILYQQGCVPAGQMQGHWRWWS